MKSLRKISPTEHRLHIKSFNIDCAPHNYFEKARMEILLGQLFAYFFERYGILFFVQRIRIVNDTVLFQFHYYKTYYDNKFLAGQEEREEILGGYLAWNSTTHAFAMEESELNAAIKKDDKFFETLKYFGSEALFKRAKAVSTKIDNDNTDDNSDNEDNDEFDAEDKSTMEHDNKLQTLLPGIKLFFEHMFATQFGFKSIILAKPLYQTFYSNPSLKAEFVKVLKASKYLQKQEWSFDVLFLAHYAITMADLNYVFAVVAKQMYNIERQSPIFKTFFGIMEKFYTMKNNIRGMKLQVKGAWDRHGRTHLFEQSVGDVSLTDFNSLVVYDSVDVITPYGAVTLKFWIHYWSVNKLV